MNEFRIIKIFIDYPNAVKAVNIIYNYRKNPLVLFDEYPTDLNHSIQNKMYSKVQLVYSIFQIAEVVKFIHSRKMIHLNLELASIFISKDRTIEIGDSKNSENNCSIC